MGRQDVSRSGAIRALVLFCCVGVVGTVPCDCHPEPKRPNFVFFLIDDLGYMDIGANNPDTFYETPNLDRLAREGMRFTNGYAANPVCSPTRYSILTGRYPSRIDATNAFYANRAGRFLPAPLNDRMPLSELTLAEALKEAGYQTAFIGKWHLGQTEELWPKAQGFDINVAGHNWGAPPGGYFVPYQNPRLLDGPDGEYLTSRLTDESLAIIDRFVQSGSPARPESNSKPFLLYLSFYTVHTPLQAPEKLVAKYEAKVARLPHGPVFADEEQVWPIPDPRRVRIRQGNATYAAMVETMDTSIGRILDKLTELDLADNTVVFFMADNGGLSTSQPSSTSNLPLRGGKGWLYEGGIREPWLIKWPGVTQPASRCDYPVISTDFYPTILEIAGRPLKADQHLDGVSLVPLLRQTGTPGRQFLFWHYPHYSPQGGFPGAAMRAGDWKLIERFEDGRVHLYNLKNDVGEQSDLADEMPERTARMRRQLHAWYGEVDAKFLRAKKDGPSPWRP